MCLPQASITPLLNEKRFARCLHEHAYMALSPKHFTSPILFVTSGPQLTERAGGDGIQPKSEGRNVSSTTRSVSCYASALVPAVPPQYCPPICWIRLKHLNIFLSNFCFYTCCLSSILECSYYLFLVLSLLQIDLVVLSLFAFMYVV